AADPLESRALAFAAANRYGIPDRGQRGGRAGGPVRQWRAGARDADNRRLGDSSDAGAARADELGAAQPALGGSGIDHQERNPADAEEESKLFGSLRLCLLGRARRQRARPGEVRDAEFRRYLYARHAGAAPLRPVAPLYQPWLRARRGSARPRTGAA